MKQSICASRWRTVTLCALFKLGAESPCPTASSSSSPPRSTLTPPASGMEKPELEVLWGGAVWDVLLPPGQRRMARDGTVRVKFEQYEEEEEYTVPLSTLRMRAEGCEDEQCSSVEEGMRVLAYTTHPRPTKLVQGQAHYEGVVTAIQRKPHRAGCACVFQVRLFDLGHAWTPAARRSPPLLPKPKRVGIQDLSLVTAPLAPLPALVGAILADSQPRLRGLWVEAGGAAWWRRALKFESGGPFDWSGQRRLEAEKGEGEKGGEDSDDDILEVLGGDLEGSLPGGGTPVQAPSDSEGPADAVPSPLAASGTPAARPKRRASTPEDAAGAGETEDRPRGAKRGAVAGEGERPRARGGHHRASTIPPGQPLVSLAACNRPVVLGLCAPGAALGQGGLPSAAQGVQRESVAQAGAEGVAQCTTTPAGGLPPQEARGAPEAGPSAGKAEEPSGAGTPVALAQAKTGSLGDAEGGGGQSSAVPKEETPGGQAVGAERSDGANGGGSVVQVRRATVARRGGRGGGFVMGARLAGGAVRQHAAGAETPPMPAAPTPVAPAKAGDPLQYAAHESHPSRGLGPAGPATTLAGEDEDSRFKNLGGAPEPGARAFSESPDAAAWKPDEVRLGSGLAAAPEGAPGDTNGGPLPLRRKRTRGVRDAEEGRGGEEEEEEEEEESWEEDGGEEGEEGEEGEGGEEEGESEGAPSGETSAGEGEGAAAASDAPVLRALQVSLRCLRSDPAANAMARARIMALQLRNASFHVWNARDPKLAVEDEFAHRFLPSTKTDLSLKDERGRSWPVTWVPRTGVFRADWKGFGDKQCLKQGSVVVLQVSGSREQPRLKAHLFRASIKSE